LTINLIAINRFLWLGKLKFYIVKKRLNLYKNNSFFLLVDFFILYEEIVLVDLINPINALIAVSHNLRDNRANQSLPRRVQRRGGDFLFIS